MNDGLVSKELVENRWKKSAYLALIIVQLENNSRQNHEI